MGALWVEDLLSWGRNDEIGIRSFDRRLCSNVSYRGKDRLVLILGCFLDCKKHSVLIFYE